jgi:ABC-type Fe3+/spermidine/putrescine transport system ATPase subunit
VVADLELHRLHKTYDGNAVVSDVTLQLPSGRILTLLGPSGCGKSTTLRIIAGLTTADAGIVRLGARDVTRVRPAQRNIGMVFQSLALFPHMTVTENIGFALRVQKFSALQRKERIQAVLELTRMNEFAHRFPGQISGGQRQRVALARAIVFNPDVLLLDEPFSALDRKLREEMQQELRALVNRIGITTVFVTHDQEEAIRLSDYVAVMNAGRIEQFDTPQAIYNHPATVFVADFMGAINFLDATVEEVLPNAISVRVADSIFSVPLDNRAAPARGSTVRINIRPERAKIEASRPSDAPAVRGRIVNRMFEGAFTAYQVQIQGDPTPWLVRQSAGQSPGPEGSPGSGETDVWVTWKPAEAHVILNTT